MYNVINEIENRISNMYGQLQILTGMQDVEFNSYSYEKSIYVSFLIECINMHYEKIKCINSNDEFMIVDF
jgi:hypothetical protein